MGRQRIEILKRLGFIIEIYVEEGTNWFQWNFKGKSAKHCYTERTEVWRDAWRFALKRGLIN